MAAVYGSMKQYASHCACSAAGTTSAPCYNILDTVCLAVSIFIAVIVGILRRLLIVS